MYVECRCDECRAEFDIKTKRPLPPWKIKCPLCNTNHITIVKPDTGSCNDEIRWTLK